MPHRNPVVSVIICFLNEERFLSEAVESVLAQTFASWELVLVDDGSHDRSTAIAQEYAARLPHQILYVDHHQHGTHGLAASRNLGLSHARGQFVAFLDADDWIRPRHLERLIGVLEADRDVAAAYCGWTYVTIDGNEAFGASPNAYGDLFAPHAEYCVSVVHTYVVSRATVEAVGRFDTSLRSCEDWDLWQRVARTGARFATIPDRLAAYRIRPGSMTSRGARLLADGLEVIRRGHAPDPRVPTPHPVYPQGLPRDELPRCELDLLCTCAGYEIGGGRDARPLLELVSLDGRVEVDPYDVAVAITTHALVAACRPKPEWGQLWPVLQPNVEPFLDALEARLRTPGLGHAARTWCRHLLAVHDREATDVLHTRSVGARFALRARAARQTLRRVHGTSRRFVGVTLSSAPHLRRLVRRPVDRMAAHVRRDDSASRLPGGHVPGPHNDEPTLAILAYAGVSPATSVATGRQPIAPELFDLQLRFLRESGYRSITPSEWRRITDGSASPTNEAVLFAFEARRDFLTHAWPLLRQYGFGATVFVATSRVGHAPGGTHESGETEHRLSWPELRQLQAEGVSFGSVGVHQRDLTALPLREAQREVRHSREVLERELGIPIATFAYPAGRHNAVIRYLVGMGGYDVAVGSDGGPCTLSDPLLALPRIQVTASDTAERLAARLHARSETRG